MFHYIRILGVDFLYLSPLFFVQILHVHRDVYDFFRSPTRVGNGIVKVTPSSDLFFLLSPTPAAGSTAISSFSFLFGLICGRGPRAGGFKGFPNLSVSMSASRPCWYTHWLLPA
uniref:Uncharacterized protein n=1 Tax=Cacopsylla melanoneura TaxID=428564 RepID=A0A8D8UVL2_9HEMI